MSVGLVEEIAVKSAALPIEQQLEVLDLVNRLASPAAVLEVGLQAEEQKKPPFQSIRGILNRKLDTLEEDLSEIRRGMWQNFPRNFPSAESK